MNDRIYCDLMLLASGVIAALAVIILGIKIPPKQEFSKFRKARMTLAISFITLSGLNLVCYFTGYDMKLDRLNTLIVAAYQALLFTGTLLVFIRPEKVTVKWVWGQIGVITGLSAVLYASMFLTPALYPILFFGAVVLLVLQFILYSISFFRSLGETLREANDYYAEECTPRLSQIRAGFILMLVIGIFAICTLFTGPWFYIIFVPTYLVCYTFVTLCTLRYIGSTSFILPAIADSSSEVSSGSDSDKASSGSTHNGADYSYDTHGDAGSRWKTRKKASDSGSGDDGTTFHFGDSSCKAGSESSQTISKTHLDIPEAEMQALRERLAQWEADKKYRERDIPYKVILQELNTDAVTMRAFMKSENGMDFRTWRNRLRLRDACTMLREHPEMTAEQISDLVGYSDGSNFHTDFKRLTGMSAGQWRSRFVGKSV